MKLLRYFSIFKISFQQEFAYRLNFIMWRVRNMMQIFLVFFLWSSVFSDPSITLFGYDRARILTYVFGIMIVKAFVFSSRAVDVPGEISRGEFTNYLLKPIGHFKYWFTRDISSKALNLIFAFFEATVLFLILKPQFFFQSDPVYLLGFVLSVSIAIFIFFVIVFMVAAIPFWYPELSWAVQFLVIVIITEFLSGGLFPLDILPLGLQNFLYLTPFPYLIFQPLQVYLGKVTPMEMTSGLVVSLIWALLLWNLMKLIWQKGLIQYRAEGR